MSSSETEAGVVELPSAGVPADQGLSSLGLIMQIAGTVLAAQATLITFMMLMIRQGDRSDSLWMFLVLGLCIVRSAYHRIAGTELLYGRRTGFDAVADKPLAGLHRYIVVALVQSVALAAIFAWKLGLPGQLVIGLGLALAAWPVTLAVLFASRRFKPFATAIPVSEDKGFEGAAILMTVFGVCGLIGAGSVLIMLLEVGGRALEGAGVLLMVALVMLVIRSALHAQAGLSGLRETSVDRSVELANRYANFGVISSFCAGGALLLIAMTSRLDLTALVLVTVMVWVLMAWPMIIRRFFSDRQFADLLAGDNASIHRRAPDAGLTGLGWLLLAHAVFGAAAVIPMLIAGTGTGKLGELTAMLGGPLGVRSLWFDAGLVVLQGWAGFELLKASPHSRVIGTIYAVIATGLTLYLTWPMFDEIRGVAREVGQQFAWVIGPLAIKVVLPVATLVLVNRKLAPTARARFRARPAPPDPGA